MTNPIPQSFGSAFLAINRIMQHFNHPAITIFFTKRRMTLLPIVADHPSPLVIRPSRWLPVYASSVRSLPSVSSLRQRQLSGAALTKSGASSAEP